MSSKQLFGSMAMAMLMSWGLAAQAAADADTAHSSTSGGVDLEEITVSARRVSENLQVVPITVTAFSADAIREAHMTDPMDFNDTVPGLSVSQAYEARASASYTLRGQGQVLGGGDPAVAIYFDDVPTQASGPGYMFDLSSIEVLKGPQGTLFGKNSTGGAVLFVPQRPTNDFGGYVDVTNGNYAQRRYQAALNIPVITDTLLVRFAMDSNRRNGYTTNPANGQQYDDTNYSAYRVSATFTPNDRIENFFLANYADLNEGGPSVQCVEVNPAGTAFPQIATECNAQFARGPRVVNLYVPPAGNYIETRNYAADNTTTFKISDDISLKNIFGYREFLQKQSYESFGFTFPLYEIIGNPYCSSGFGLTSPSDKTYSEELQLHGNSMGHRLQWTGGIFFDNVSPHSTSDRDESTGLFIGNGTTDIQTISSIKHSKSRAVYGQATYDLTDKLNLTLGARYTQDKKTNVGSQYVASVNTCVYGVTPAYAAGNGSYCNISGSDTFSSPTWDASLQYQLTPDNMVFLTTRRGYISGGFNAVAPVPQEFKAEHTTDVEIGEKTEFHFGDVKGRLNASVYYSKFSDGQERFIVSLPVTINGVTTDQRFAYFGNAAKGVVQGLELEGTIIPTSHLEFSVNYAYTDAYYTQNMFEGVNYIDSPVPDTARNKVSATARYLLGLPSSVGDASVSATASSQTKKESALTSVRSSDAGLGPYGTALPGYTVLNLHADWKHVMGNPLDLSLYVDNATNRTYLTFFQNWWSIGYNQGIYAPPRQWGVSARWSFGHQ